jgi:polygalacturonase
MNFHPQPGHRPPLCRLLHAPVILAVCAALLLPRLATAQTSPADWARLPGILAHILPPAFPANDFSITNYGAVGDGVTDCTLAFSNAIAACNAAGGGRVDVPAGAFLTGAIHLLSNVDINVASNGIIRFTTNTNAYLPVVYTRDQGIEVMNFSPFIYACQQTNIALTGSGLIDGQAGSANWYAWESSGAEGNDFTLLENEATAGVPTTNRIFGAGYFLRPVFIQPFKCCNVLIQGLTFTNSPMWNLNPVYCTNVTIQNVTVNEGSSPNTDGCDPDSSTYVLIKNCSFNDGDDCSAIKAGRDVDGLRVNIPSQNIVYQNDTFKAGHGGVTCGSETSGGITNVFAENCYVNSGSQEQAVRLKSCPERGGYIENLYVRNWIVANAQAGISATMSYCTGGTNYPVISNIDIRDCIFTGVTGSPLSLSGYSASYPVTYVTIANCQFSTSGASFTYTNNITLLNNKGGGF